MFVVKEAQVVNLEMRKWIQGSSCKVHSATASNEPRHEPRHEKTCILDYRPGETQTGLLSYRD